VIETCACLFAFFQAFAYYGLNGYDVATVNNNFFPSGDDSDYLTRDGVSLSSADQAHILAVAQGQFYLMVVIIQVVNVFCCRGRVASIFQQGFFTNKYTNYGVVCALCLGILVVYCPGIQIVTGAYNAHSLHILYATLLFGPILLAWCEGRKWFTRTYPEHWVNGYLAW
jgi:sodium/potassium-transporting ATPase subunit alpha